MSFYDNLRRFLKSFGIGLRRILALAIGFSSFLVAYYFVYVVSSNYSQAEIVYRAYLNQINYTKLFLELCTQAYYSRNLTFAGALVSIFVASFFTTLSVIGARTEKDKESLLKYAIKFLAVATYFFVFFSATIFGPDSINIHSALLAIFNGFASLLLLETPEVAVALLQGLVLPICAPGGQPKNCEKIDAVVHELPGRPTPEPHPQKQKNAKPRKERHFVIGATIGFLAGAIPLLIISAIATLAPQLLDQKTKFVMIFAVSVSGGVIYFFTHSRLSPSASPRVLLFTMYFYAGYLAIVGSALFFGENFNEMLKVVEVLAMIIFTGLLTATVALLGAEERRQRSNGQTSSQNP